ncbi:MAG TPA: hypothetical protein G4N93_04175 [Dehalococcoidia bacterium]|nr:hypothetical protein [Dehalococcoidia bacterium]
MIGSLFPIGGLIAGIITILGANGVGVGVTSSPSPQAKVDKSRMDKIVNTMIFLALTFSIL